MDDLLNLNQYGYQIDRQLGCNREGGRITWKGRHLNSQETVVIKQFCFATADSSWSGYKAYEQEIAILKQLDRPGIPQYLEGIETENGFCLIQEYIPAPNLNHYQTLTIAEVERVALELLDILIYLQQQNPPIIHRDIKPDNILLDDQLKVYLIDFGFASLGSKEVTGSSVFRGTPGFIAPEQIIKPTLATDLYSLGITLICLLSHKSISEIRELGLTDNPYELNLTKVLPDLDAELRNWLEKMIAVKTSVRFGNAALAKEALLSIRDSDKTDVLTPEFDSINIDWLKIDWLKTTVGTLAVVGSSCLAIWGIDFVDRHVESTAINIAIAILAGVVVGITKLSAVEITKIDRQARLQGAIMAIGVPVFLVVASGFIWGKGEAMDIAAAILVAEAIVLSYFWWQLPGLQPRKKQLKFGFLCAAVFTGISLGLQLI
ncbi:MAG: serine/threonine-protein kinase [Cyanobacteria bacterium P01_G01_bin.19]